MALCGEKTARAPRDPEWGIPLELKYLQRLKWVNAEHGTRFAQNPSVMLNQLRELPPLTPHAARVFPEIPGRRPADAMQAAPPGAFAGVLGAAVEQLRGAEETAGPAAVQTVQAGDTLSHIVLRQMKAEGLRPTLPELYARVDEIARNNRLHDPDLIMPGQEIVFSGSVPRPVSVEMAATDPPPLPATSDVARPAPQAALAGVVDRASGAGPWHAILDGPARLTSQHGMRTHPITGRRHFHAGIDLAAPAGTPIRAWRPGVVTFSGPQGGYGNTVIVRHADGVETLYAHASRNLVKEGDRVGGDTVLALVGSTGRSTGPHLHFEVRRNGHVLDPMPYLARDAERSRD